MANNRLVDDLSLEELETLVEQRRRIERARRFAETDPERRFRPVTVLPKQAEPKSRAARRPQITGLRNRVLLFVEIAAVVGLVAIIIGSTVSLQSLNQEALQARLGTPVSGDTSEELPASSFPPSNLASELPGGSSPPDSAPPALGIRLQAVAAIPVPTPGPRSPTRIVIPTINVDWPVVQGDSWDQLKQGIGHRVGSVNPGERGNLILSGHNDVYGEPFRNLDRLEVGALVQVHAGSSAYRYVIKAKRVISPNDLSVLASSRNPIITLITCTPYRVDTMRLVLIGELAP